MDPVGVRGYAEVEHEETGIGDGAADVFRAVEEAE